MLQFADEYLFGVRGASLFLLRALAFGNVEHGSDPARDLPAVVFFRCVDDMEESRSDALVVDFSLKFDAIALQDFLDMGTNRVKVLVAQDVRQPFADDIFRSTATHLQIGVADEAIAKIPVQPDEHERRAVDDALELGLLFA